MVINGIRSPGHLIVRTYSQYYDGIHKYDNIIGKIPPHPPFPNSESLRDSLAKSGKRNYLGECRLI
jgi:hypothetical protein